ncbi:MAG TPA: serine/threonine-protein kinase [Kofleriaceae bacterium]|nr:serine/threonine-protein kinase [Kofleriaceae bacterium]
MTGGSDDADRAPPSELQASDRTLTSDPRALERSADRGGPAGPTLTGSPRDRERYQILAEHARGGLGRVSRAHDRELGRDIAIKEPLTHDHIHEIRFLREALITARLEHPGIVPVHEVGRWPDGTPFYAMKLVSGRPLRELLAERPTVEQRITLLHHVIAVAEAIAYAHGRGIIHRDLKPSNVIVGDFGETVVIDWGLAKDLSADDAPVDGGGPVRSPRGDGLTEAGAVLGTPRYMAPEQKRGARVDQRADVYAIGAMLWELCALDEVPAGDRERYRMLRRTGIARDLAVVIDKALDPDPARRYPDAGPLAADLNAFKSGARITARNYSALARLVRWVRQHRTLMLASAAVLSALAAIAMSLRIAPDPCAAPTARVAAVWNPVRRAAVHERLVTVDPVQGASRFERIAAAIDRGAERWSAMHVEACRATRVEGRQSDTLLDRRMDCLDRWLGELGETVRVVEQVADLAAVDHAAKAASELSPLATCADVHALGEALPPPIDAARRAMADALARRTQELEVAERAGRLEGLAAQAQSVVAEARALDHPPALAGALTVQMLIAAELGDDPGAETAARELTQVAARARDDHAAAFAWTLLMRALGRHGKPDLALALVPTASAMVLRAGDPPDLRADLLYSHASLLDEGPRPEDALAMLTDARRVLEQAGASSPGSPFAPRLADIVFETATTQLRLNQLDAASASLRDAIERWRALWGTDSADEAFGWKNLGGVLHRQGKRDEALAAFRAAARIREARMGPSALTARALESVAGMLTEMGRWDEALAIYDRALAMARRALPPGDVQIAGMLIGRSEALGKLGRFDEADRGYDEVLALYERAGARNSNLPIALNDRADLLSRRGRCDEARRDYARSIALFEELLGPTVWRLIYPLVGEAGCLIHAGSPGEAIALLERALNIPAQGDDTFELALARYYLGRARVETRSDVAGGLAMVRAARAVIAVAPGKADTLRELDGWLAGPSASSRPGPRP